MVFIRFLFDWLETEKGKLLSSLKWLHKQPAYSLIGSIMSSFLSRSNILLDCFQASV
jgi:hypothetical protein